MITATTAIKLDSSQQAAVDNIVKLESRVYLLIGGPGSGKTFTIRHLLRRLWDDAENFDDVDDIDTPLITNATTYLAAPTGRAAKIMNDTFSTAGFHVENPARTIHRLLKYSPGMGWQHNEFNPLDATLVIIDESSMIDSMLLSKVISALPEGCVLILVGDGAQAQPVSPGSPFVDMILYGLREIINRLVTNHRQAQGSLIADGCMKVLEGIMPVWGTRGDYTLGGTLQDDLFLVEELEKENIPAMAAGIVRPWHEQGLDWIALAPQRTGVCGVEAMNKYLQEVLNPAADGKAEIKAGWVVLREGDKVLQTKNCYELGDGGVFNGFCGVIRSIEVDPFNDDNRVVLVDFDGMDVEYREPKHIKDLALGYCRTIHSAQGGEHQYGLLIFHSSHYYMGSRNLLYTAMSRFRKELHIIGDKKMLKRGLRNVVSGERQTYLKLVLGDKG